MAASPSHHVDEKHKHLIKQLKTLEQSHILRLINLLTPKEKEEFWHQLHNIDFAALMQAYGDAKFTDEVRLTFNLKPLSAVSHNLVDILSIRSDSYKQWSRMGYDSLLKGEVGIILLEDREYCQVGSMGLSTAGLLSGKTIFNIYAQRIQKIYMLAKAPIEKLRWYICVNDQNISEIQNEFIENQYFGLSKHNVVFLECPTNPCFDNKGKIIIRGKSQLVLTPEGDAGFLDVIRKKSLLDEMKKHKIKYFFIYNAHNLLVKILDPTFIGFMVDKKSDFVMKMVRRKKIRESEYIVCEQNGRPRIFPPYILEDRSDDIKNAITEALDIGSYIVSIAFFQRMVKDIGHCNYHIVKQRNMQDSAIDIVVNPTGQMLYSIQRHFTEMLAYCDDMYILEVQRWDEYSPLIIDEVDGKLVTRFALHDLYSMQRVWIESAGGVVNEHIQVELSPLLSYMGEGLAFLDGQYFTGNTIVTSHTSVVDAKDAMTASSSQQNSEKSVKRVSVVNFEKNKASATDLRELYKNALSDSSIRKIPSVFRFNSGTDVTMNRKSSSIQLEAGGVQEFRNILLSSKNTDYSIHEEENNFMDSGYNMRKIDTPTSASSKINPSKPKINTSKPKIKKKKKDEPKH